MIGLAGIATNIQRDSKVLKQAEVICTDEADGFLFERDTIKTSTCLVSVWDESLKGGVSKEEDYLTIVAGDIYEDNFIGRKGRSKADYVLQIYLSSGAEACAEINGSYTFMLHDSKKGETVIGTDANSFIPLYYTVYENRLYFSWNIHALLKVFSSQPDINYSNLFSWVLIGPPGYDDETRINTIKRLDAGTVITCKSPTLLGIPYPLPRAKHAHHTQIM